MCIVVGSGLELIPREIWEVQEDESSSLGLGNVRDGTGQWRETSLGKYGRGRANKVVYGGEKEREMR